MHRYRYLRSKVLLTSIQASLGHLWLAGIVFLPCITRRLWIMLSLNKVIFILCIARYLWGRHHHHRPVQHGWLRPRLYLHHRPSGQPRRSMLLQQRLQAGPQQEQLVRGPRRVPGRCVQPVVREHAGQLRLHVLRGSRDGQRPAHVQPVSQSALRRRVSRGLLLQRPHAGLWPRQRLCLSERLDRKRVPAWRGRVCGRPGCVRWGEAVFQHRRLVHVSLSARLCRGFAGSLRRWVGAWKMQISCVQICKNLIVSVLYTCHRLTSPSTNYVSHCRVLSFLHFFTFFFNEP